MIWIGHELCEFFPLGLSIYIHCHCYTSKNVDVYFACLSDCDSVFLYKVKVTRPILKYMYCLINLSLRIFVRVHEWVRKMPNSLEYSHK